MAIDFTKMLEKEQEKEIKRTQKESNNKSINKSDEEFYKCITDDIFNQLKGLPVEDEDFYGFTLKN